MTRSNDVGAIPRFIKLNRLILEQIGKRRRRRRDHVSENERVRQSSRDTIRRENGHPGNSGMQKQMVGYSRRCAYYARTHHRG